MQPEDLREHYSKYYGDRGLSEWRRISSIDKAAHIQELWLRVGNPPGPSVTEIGCGDGAVIEAMMAQNFGAHFLGVDISQSAIGSAIRRVPSERARFLLFDGERVPVQDCSSDLVVLSHVLEHVEEPRKLLREAARIARYVFVEVPLELNLATASDFQWTNVGHINLYDPLIIRHMVQSIGLHVIGQKISCPSRRVFACFRRGPLGFLKWMYKASMLRIVPFLAYRLHTYNGCLLATSVGSGGDHPGREAGG